MPLSEHEQKLLDQMERALYAEDPSFATQMKGHGRAGGAPKTRLVGGIIVAILGLGVVVLGVSAASIPLGILGFVIMVAGVAWAATPARTGRPDGARKPGQRPGRAQRAAKGGRKPRGGSSFMQKMDDRWERRRQQGF